MPITDDKTIEAELNEENEHLCQEFMSLVGSLNDPTKHLVLHSNILEKATLDFLCDNKLLPELIFCSPPYNANVNYGLESNDNKPLGEYLSFLTQFLLVATELLKPGGRLVINIRDIKSERGRFPIICHLYNLLEPLGYSYRGLHVWYKGREESSMAWGSWMSSSNPAIIDLYEYVFVFQAPGEKAKGEDNLAKMEFVESVLGVWKIRPVKKIVGKDKKNIFLHPCPFPIDLALRVIKLYSHVGDLVIDPFGGICSTSIASAMSGRNSVSIDISGDYCDFGYSRLKSVCRPEDDMFADYPIDFEKKSLS